MQIIKLNPVTINKNILLFLEKRKLVRMLKPSQKVSRVKCGQGCVETKYISSPRFGSHKLICIGLNSDKIVLNSHPDNEEFIIISGAKGKFKPLYMVIGLHKHDTIERKAKKKQLTEKDFMLLQLKYNDGLASVFTMLKNTPHCEVTRKGRGKPPVFFVSEPSNLRMHYPDLGGYGIKF